MMLLFKGWVAKYGVVIAIALVVLLIVAGTVIYIQSLQHKIDTLTKDNATITVQRDALQANNEELVASIQVTNQALDSMKKLMPDVNKKLDDINTRIGKQTSTLQTAVADILKGEKPKTCEDAIKYLINASKEGS